MQDMARKGRSGPKNHPERMPRGERHGSHLHPERMPRGERHGLAKLTESQVREIKQRLRNGEKHREIAPHFNVAKETVASISSGRNWRHVVID